MKQAVFILIAASLALLGCKRNAVYPESNPPSAPTGLSTSTGDNFIEIFWEKGHDPDIAGYNVFVSASYDGRYELIGSTKEPYFMDKGAVNGNVYYYAVTAYDYEGNESPLSKDVAYDIPRPEGYNVTLGDYHRRPEAAGYDFSNSAVVSFDDRYADMFFENANGVLYLDVQTDSDIEDMGATRSILDIAEAPSSGWSSTHDAEIQEGHTYVIWTWDDHYAKVRVTGLTPSRVTFDWAYQVRPSTPLLKHGGGERSAATAAHPH
jgi:hypothetical protein